MARAGLSLPPELPSLFLFFSPVCVRVNSIRTEPSEELLNDVHVSLGHIPITHTDRLGTTVLPSRGLLRLRNQGIQAFCLSNSPNWDRQHP
jgi:hypothetical protein